MIKNIIFDFGGVVLKHRATIMEEFISKMFDIPQNINQLKKNLIALGINSSIP